MLRDSKAHLESVNESYFGHQLVAFRYGFNCMRAGLMAFVHGLIPGLFQASASDLVKRLASNRTDEASGPREKTTVHR